VDHQPAGQEAASSSRKERRPRERADDGADFVARGQHKADCVFNLAALHSAYPIKRQPSAQRTQAAHGVENRKSLSLDPLENTIGRGQSVTELIAIVL